MNAAIRIVPHAIDAPDYCHSAISYDQYMELMGQMVTSAGTTGADQTEDHVQFTYLNNRRMVRWNKTLALIPELRDFLDHLQRPICFLAITESWCGDAAHTLPLFQRLSVVNDMIQLKIIFRDENTELMSDFLTNGLRSIPIVLAFVKEDDGYRFMFKWGPYTQPVVQMKNAHKTGADGLSKPDYQKQLQSWYNSDKSETLQREVLELLRQHL